MGSLFQHIHYGLRQLFKNKAYAAVTIVTLALGSGANTVIFSAVNGLLRPLPVRNPEQIVVLTTEQKGAPLGANNFSYPDFLDFQKQAKKDCDLFAYYIGFAGLSADGVANQVTVSYVNGSYFPILGINPFLGRLFSPEEADAASADSFVILGYAYWRKRFDGRKDVIGKQVMVDGKPATIIGVTPRKFQGTHSLIDMDAYLPLGNGRNVGGLPPMATISRRARVFRVLGRLQPGVSLAQAQSSLNVIAGRLAAQYPATNVGVAIHIYPERLARPEPAVANALPRITGLFLILGVLALLLACMNVANIVAVRTTARTREMAVRAALGANRGRLISQTFIECILLAFLGGIAGVVLAWWGSSIVSSLRLTASGIPVALDFSFDWRVFRYSFIATAFTGFLIAILPVLRDTRPDFNANLREGGRTGASRGRLRMRNLLALSQVGGSLALLIVAGLFVRSLQRAQHLYLGFDSEHLLNVTMDPQQAGYEKARTEEFYRELETKARALPGVTSVSLAYSVPMTGINDGGFLYIEGHPVPSGQQPPLVLSNRIDPGYFETMRVSLVKGRVFTETDNQGAPLVAIVNQTMASRFWMNEDPIGKRISLNSPSGPPIQVVGVAADSKYGFIAENPQPYFYVPLAQSFSTRRALQVRSSGEPESLVVSVQNLVRELAPALPINVQSMKEVVAGENGLLLFRLAATLAATMGLLGLVLAVVGVYGVVSYSAEQRVREIGIRMAMGAPRNSIFELVLKQGLKLVVIGVFAGLLVAFALARIMSSLLVGVSAIDPLTFLLVTISLVFVTLWACLFPAWRAMRVEPGIVLRYE